MGAEGRNMGTTPSNAREGGGVTTHDRKMSYKSLFYFYAMSTALQLSMC